jgi:hypothetical protein
MKKRVFYCLFGLTGMALADFSLNLNGQNAGNFRYNSSGKIGWDGALKDPDTGAQLSVNAARFKNYLTNNPDSRLTLTIPNNTTTLTVQGTLTAARVNFNSPLWHFHNAVNMSQFACGIHGTFFEYASKPRLHECIIRRPLIVVEAENGSWRREWNGGTIDTGVTLGDQTFSISGKQSSTVSTTFNIPAGTTKVKVWVRGFSYDGYYQFAIQGEVDHMDTKALLVTNGSINVTHNGSRPVTGSVSVPQPLMQGYKGNIKVNFSTELK